ncbi:probable glutathione S-transferase [Prosopis cineraria]|uniref:probable glutathione S-transferase n=1 Tax=Prosopis cineraria TaxID=364024 RepID=UPI00240FA4F9|nr:probable glutathione S-transferase [Prosopis cineraria]XP_054817332.1 probable glutathione S-transferase [Prosopis cineraria]
MSKGNSVVLLDFWGSPFCLRARIALEEKSVTYEGREENLLGGKSDLLLKSNPIHKKVPVLLHNDQPVAESANIVAYIDEAWPSNPLLPTNPYERAQARFWADYIDKEVFETGKGIWLSKGEEGREVAKKNLIEVVKNLEGALGDKSFFGGDAFGYVDIIALGPASWFYAYEKIGGFKLEAYCPKFSSWFKRCLQRPSVAKAFPDPEKVHQLVLKLSEIMG